MAVETTPLNRLSISQ